MEQAKPDDPSHAPLPLHASGPRMPTVRLRPGSGCTASFFNLPPASLDIATPDTTAAAGPIASAPLLRPRTAHRVCRVCAAAEARYACPRCNVPFCSRECFGRHGDGSCTEAFYKEHVTENLEAASAANARTTTPALREAKERGGSTDGRGLGAGDAEQRAETAAETFRRCSGNRSIAPHRPTHTVYCYIPSLSHTPEKVEEENEIDFGKLIAQNDSI